MEFDNDTVSFIREREEKLGGSLIYRSYATWYGEANGNEREYGVFLYSDGSTLAIEDFERTPTLFGIKLKPNVKKEYTKLEIFIPIPMIKAIDKITRSSAERSLKAEKDLGKKVNLFDRIFRKTVIRVALDNGDCYYFEIPDCKELEKLIKEKE